MLLQPGPLRCQMIGQVSRRCDKTCRNQKFAPPLFGISGGLQVLSSLALMCPGFARGIDATSAAKIAHRAGLGIDSEGKGEPTDGAAPDGLALPTAGSIRAGSGAVKACNRFSAP